MCAAMRRLLLLCTAASLPCAAALKNCTAHSLGCKPSCSPDSKDALGNRHALLHRLCKLCKCRQCEQCVQARPAHAWPLSDARVTLPTTTPGLSLSLSLRPGAPASS